MTQDGEQGRMPGAVERDNEYDPPGVMDGVSAVTRVAEVDRIEDASEASRAPRPEAIASASTLRDPAQREVALPDDLAAHERFASQERESEGR